MFLITCKLCSNYLSYNVEFLEIQSELQPRKLSNGDANTSHKTCTTVLSSDGMPKSSVSSQTDASLLNRQQSLRDQLSKSPGTAV